MLSRQRLERYRAEVDAAAARASEFVDGYIEAMMAEMPDATVAETRQAAVDAITDSMYVFGDQAAEVACELFDELALDAGSPKSAAIYGDLIDAAKVDEKVRYLARKLVVGDREGFGKSIRDVTAYYVKRSAMECMVRNCHAQQVRYARVTTGLEACPFCFMLSSRGFVYHSEALALGLHGYHEHCNCVAVPGFADVDEDAQIEGYAPGGMRDRFRMCAETVGVVGAKSLDPEYRKKVLGEVETRDWRWLYSGTVPEPTFASEKVRKGVMEDNPWEGRSGYRVANVGIRPDFIVDYAYEVRADGVKYRVGLPDLRDGSEIKTPTTSNNAVGAMLNYLESVHLKKKGVKRMIVDNFESNFTDGDIETATRKAVAIYGTCPVPIYILGKNGKLKQVQKELT